MSGVPYLQPKSMGELKGLLPSLPEGTAVLAGGTDLMVAIRERGLDCACILSLWCVPELRKIREEDGWLRIGAMVTHAEAARDGRVRRYFRGLAMACGHVGSQQIRNKGTLGGNLMNASPAGDIAPCLFLYGGQVELLGEGGVRRLAAEEFLTAPGKPNTRAGEVLTAILLPVDRELDSCFVKLGSRREVTIAQISLCAAWKMEDGAPAEVRAFAGAIDRRPCPFPRPELLARPETAEQAGQALSGQIRDIRQRRSRPSKLKITPAEQLYKERAAMGVVCDLMEAMGVLPSRRCSADSPL